MVGVDNSSLSELTNESLSSLGSYRRFFPVPSQGRRYKLETTGAIYYVQNFAKSVGASIQNFGNFTAASRTSCRESSAMVSKNLTAALQECEENSNCSMFYDRCGGGSSFESCATFDLRNDSSCGSILYSKSKF